MSRRSFSVALGFGPLLLLGSACADRALSHSTCSDVPIQASAGIQPTFRWNPACQIQALTVHLPGPGAVIWTTFSHPQANAIVPPVTYGIFSDEAAQTANIFLPLVAGTSYQVSLYRVDEGRGSSLQSIGTATFVP